MQSETQRVTFRAASDGPLLAGVLHLPAGTASCPSAVVCHPHPLMGGTMDNAIVVAVCRRLAARGWIALRFDFRGAGRSAGSFDEGRGEMDDVAGALDFLAGQAEVDPHKLAIAGYSFGAAVALRHSVRDPRPRWLIGIALVQSHYADRFLDSDPRPKFFVAGERDAWAPPEKLRRYVARLRPPAELHVLPGTDHSFWGHESEVAEIVAGWLAANAIR